MRTTDTDYGPDYWNTLDDGRGYQDSLMWADIAHALHEVFLVDRVAGRDRSLEMSLVDVGAAFGYLIRHLRKRGLDTWGLDFSDYARSQAPEDVAFYLRAFDLTDTRPPPFDGKVFHVVTCFETLEHIAEEHVPRALGHLRDLLAPSGHAVLTICVDTRPDALTDPTHVTLRPRAWWEDQLEAAGLRSEPELEAELRRFWLFSLHGGVHVVTPTEPAPPAVKETHASTHDVPDRPGDEGAPTGADSRPPRQRAERPGSDVARPVLPAVRGGPDLD